MSQKAQGEQSSCPLRAFAPWRLCVKLFIFSWFLAPWATVFRPLLGLARHRKIGLLVVADN
jgi:hypothetical protein